MSEKRDAMQVHPLLHNSLQATRTSTITTTGIPSRDAARFEVAAQELGLDARAEVCAQARAEGLGEVTGWDIAVDVTQLEAPSMVMHADASVVRHPGVSAVTVVVQARRTSDRPDANGPSPMGAA
jgi:hypothetical protein